MRYIILTTLSILVLNFTNAQRFNIEYGRLISQFDYKNSNGEHLNNLQGTTNNHISVGFDQVIRRSSFYFISEITYNKYAAVGSDLNLNNYYSWDVNYLGIHVGGAYEFFKKPGYINVRNTNTEQGFTLTLSLYGGPEFLMQGTQVINETTYNLKGVEQFDKPFIFALGSLSVNYHASKSFFAYLKYQGGKGFSVFKSKEDKEDLNFIINTVIIGLSISLPAHI